MNVYEFDVECQVVKIFSTAFLETLCQEAEVSVRYRQHVNLHATYEDPCQRFFNAIGTKSYIRPHRHSIDPKTECLIAVRGLMALVVFDDSGEVNRVVRFGTERYGATEPIAVGVELPSGAWHTVIAETPNCILFEVKAGPFDPEGAKEWAEWAPAEGTPEADRYLSDLRHFVTTYARETVPDPFIFR